jgi:hypothetical protein
MDSHSVGISAFLIENETPNPLNRFIRVNFIPGSPQEQSAYRSELGGASGIIATVESIASKFQLQSGSIIIGLDGEQAMWNASDKEDFLDPKQACFDMLSDIHFKVRNSVITYHWKWVEGHQMDKGGVDFAHMDRWGQLNHEADQLARAYTLSCIQTNQVPTPMNFRNEGWRCYLNGNKLANLNFDSLYVAIYGDHTTDYWTAKCNLPPPVTRIDWDICHSAIRSLPFGKRRWLIKHLTGFCGVGKMLERWNEDTSHCPRCDQLNEDTTHLILCPALQAMATWETSLQGLSQWMLETHTLPSMRHYIILRLLRWRLNQHPPPLPSYDEFGLFHAISEQTSIGWNFLDGFVTTEWKTVQDEYYKWLDMRRTGRRWIIALLTKLWDVSWSMWEDRNDARHTAITPRKVIAIREANITIHNLYLDGSPTVLHRDQKLFDRPLYIVLQQTLPEKELWIDIIQLAQAALISHQEWAPNPSMAHLHAQQALRIWLNSATNTPSI